MDGIMFLSGPWSKVFAIDARNGKLIWTYDPRVHADGRESVL
jgi:quinohemoprotein ethanol dehydrogenase